MNMNMRSESVESEFAKWSEYYEIPFQVEFEVKALLELQKQYATTPDDHIKTKREILEAIRGIKSTLKLEKKRQEIPKNDKVKVLIVCKYTEVSKYIQLFKDLLIKRENIVQWQHRKNEYIVETFDYILEIIPQSEELIRGKRFHTYINLTGDVNFEDTYLRVQLIKNSDTDLPEGVQVIKTE